MDSDREYLKILSIFYYVAAGLAALGGCFLILYLFAAILLVLANPLGALFVLFALFGVTIAWSAAYLLYSTAKNLSACENRSFCVVIAAIICFIFPLGTILGGLTIFLLVVRPNSRELFQD